MKKITDDIARSLEKCAEALSITELSKSTGIRIDILRDYITKQTNIIKEETWTKLSPVLAPYLSGPEAMNTTEPPRIGKPYRRHHELVEMSCDQKILLDVFDALADFDKETMLKNFQRISGQATPLEYKSLTEKENAIMASFLAMSPEGREENLLKIINLATEEVKRRRKELF